MNAAVKYTLGRFGLLAVVFLVLLMFPLNIFVNVMISALVSAVLSYFLMAKWRNEMAEQLAAAAGRRVAEKERLRAALAGDGAAAAAGDRAAPVGSDRAAPVGSDRAAPVASDRAAPVASDRAAPVASDRAVAGQSKPDADRDAPAGATDQK